MVGGTRALVMTGVEGGSRAAAPKEKEEEKIPLMCESIYHRRLRSRCPTRSLDQVACVGTFENSQADRQINNFFKKDISNSYSLLQASSPLFRVVKNAIKNLKNNFVTD